jgi:hypothetical protein
MTNGKKTPTLKAVEQGFSKTGNHVRMIGMLLIELLKTTQQPVGKTTWY